MFRASCPLAIAALLVACNQPLMEDQPRYEPYESSTFFSDGMASRPIPEGTVARGQLRDDDHLYTGRVDGQVVDSFPFAIGRADLERGQERYDIYCAPCHDRAGTGMGMIVQRGFRQPPSFHEPALRQAPVGHFFEVISFGIGMMPDYAMQLEPADRWRVIAYIRALQLSQHAPLSAAPPAERAELQEVAP